MTILSISSPLTEAYLTSIALLPIEERIDSFLLDLPIDPHICSETASCPKEPSSPVCSNPALSFDRFDHRLDKKGDDLENLQANIQLKLADFFQTPEPVLSRFDSSAAAQGMELIDRLKSNGIDWKSTGFKILLESILCRDFKTPSPKVFEYYKSCFQEEPKKSSFDFLKSLHEKSPVLSRLVILAYFSVSDSKTTYGLLIREESQGWPKAKKPTDLCKDCAEFFGFERSWTTPIAVDPGDSVINQPFLVF